MPPVFARQIGEPHPWTTVLSWSGAVLISASLVTFLVLQVMTAHAATAVVEAPAARLEHPEELMSILLSGGSELTLLLT